MAEGPAAFLSGHPVRKLRFDGRGLWVVRVRGLTTARTTASHKTASHKTDEAFTYAVWRRNARRKAGEFRFASCAIEVFSRFDSVSPARANLVRHSATALPDELHHAGARSTQNQFRGIGEDRVFQCRRCPGGETIGHFEE